MNILFAKIDMTIAKQKKVVTKIKETNKNCDTRRPYIKPLYQLHLVRAGGAWKKLYRRYCDDKATRRTDEMGFL